MRRSLSTTTALVASLSLALPFPSTAIAQSGGVLESFECPEGMSVEDCAALQEEALGEAAPEAAPAVEAEVETPNVEAEAQAETEAEASSAAEDQPEAETATEVETEADAGAEVETEPDTTVAPEAEAAPEAVQEEGAAPEAETAPEVEAEVTVEEETEAEATAAPETEAAPEAVQEESAEAEAETEAEVTAEVEETVPTGPSDAALEAAEGGSAEAAASVEDADAVEETTETVTAETVRGSDEEFAEEDSPAATAEGNGGGLSTLERGLIAAGAGLVVGALLSGNREVVSTAPDRVVVQDGQGNLQVIRDDDAILRQAGDEVTTRRFDDGSTRTVITRPDGTQTVTIRNAEMRVLRRSVIGMNGVETVLFDDTQMVEPVNVSALPEARPAPATSFDPNDPAALRAALAAQSQVGRAFSLAQVRNIDRVRYLAPAITIQNVTFETGSAAILPSEAEELSALGQLMTDLIAENPGEVFLIEGHTDAIGSRALNLALSDRRAESVALALSEYFGVSPANMVLQGYGESDLRIQTQDASRENRRVVVRRVTPLLQVARSD